MDDKFDVMPDDVDIAVDYIYWRKVGWQPRRLHLVCLNCDIRKELIAGTDGSCCSNTKSPNYHTRLRTAWTKHLDTHRRRGDNFPDKFYEMKLPEDIEKDGHFN